ncbi:DUF6134 family protein [Sediminicoccus sp. KRV36]|uniref:DUF6134 family protein n=1 Tax=Sediminicoccus sp. KRV36 TaxID=3133721 RepID=UPI00200FF505|nr:DUF6134 family protein [Sediminicoccus rosea]UPY34947.1 DUF6134 family protein [Sediminicoccus rosea]
MLGRRRLPLLLAAPAAAPGLARAQSTANYRWRVLRNGTEIGSHNITFTERGGERIAVSENIVTPRVMGIVVFRYEHRLTEVTRAGRFVSVRSSLNRNGTIVEVAAEAAAQGVALRGPEGTLNLPAQAVPLSWWEPQRFGGAVPLFGTTTGKPLDLRWTREALPAGTRWRTAGEIEAVLEFDASGRWTAYQVKGDDGSTVIYAAA